MVLPLLLMALIVFVAILVVGYPLVNPEQYEYADADPGNAVLEHLTVTRNSVFDAIRDLESDRATGKLSDTDYSQLRARYDVQAAQVLQQIDAVSAAEALHSRAEEPHPQPADAELATCPHCHRHIQPNDRFCPTCGARIG